MRQLIPRRLRHASVIQDILFVVASGVGHIPSARLRHAFYRAVMGVELGRGARINGRAEIRKGRVRIGKNSVIGHDAILDGRLGIEIGESVNLSSEVAIWTMQHDHRDLDFRSVGGPVTVGDHAWLSFRAVVLPGVSIGPGAVVAAGAVVTGDVPPYSVVAGMPAKVIGTRPKTLRYALGSTRHFI